MDERAEFEPFKMLIGAVFALLVLTIIISAIQFFDDFRTRVSVEKFYTGLKNAAEQPNGQALVIENVFFDKGTIFAATAVARRIGLETDCVELSADPANPYLVFTSAKSLEIRAQMETSVFAVCETNLSGALPGCEISCTISFGQQQ